MSDALPEHADDVARLLAERGRYAEWLERVEASGTGIPDAVRQRVRADYAGRLDAVMRELGAYADAVRADVRERRETHARAVAALREAEERRAEAELRHRVGEYSDREWQEARHAADTEIGMLRHDVEQAQAEVERAEEVERVIVGSSVRQLARDVLALEVEAEAATDSLDALVRETMVPPTPTVPAAPPAPPAEPAARASAQARPAEPPPLFLDLALETGTHPVLPLPEVAPDRPVPPPPREPASEAQRCRTCGTMNKATEWYCGSCGAELTAT
ncbi:MAG: hypothetical protein NW201_05000 [Gemmatimonadales bacterium]|nr:hypothetical protein [Gemmatimonadales bacterium]